MKFQVSSRLYIFLFILLKLFLNYYELFFTSSLKLLYGKNIFDEFDRSAILE